MPKLESPLHFAAALNPRSDGFHETPDPASALA